MTTTENGSTTAAATQVPVRLDFDARAAGFARAMSHLDQAATKELDAAGINPLLRELIRIRAFWPLRFEPDGWLELMRLEPGSVVSLHRHTGEVHAFNLSGTREILGTGEIAGPAATPTSLPEPPTPGERSVTSHASCTSRSPAQSSTSTPTGTSPRQSMPQPSALPT